MAQGNQTRRLPAGERTYDELLNEVIDAGWNIGELVRSTHGVTMTFRRHYTSDSQGIETKEAFGKGSEVATTNSLPRSSNLLRNSRDGCGAQVQLNAIGHRSADDDAQHPTVRFHANRGYK